MNKTVLPPLFWLLVIIATFCWVKVARADPMLTAEQGGVRITIYTEACKLKEVHNLPKRATWIENGKTVEGCAGYIQELEMIQFYWSDKTAIPVPAAMFERITGA